MTEMDPISYYDADPEREWDRLAESPTGRMEYENTLRELERALPLEGRVLDAGGGPGRYAIHLAEAGLDVVHCDLSGELVAFARRQVRAAGVGDRVTLGRADVRSLPYGDGAFDGVCCLGGVLSHVLDADERARAIGELARVADDGAPVVVSVIGRLAAMRFRLKEVEPDSAGLLGHLAETGDYTAEAITEFGDGEGWAECHFYRVAELESELSDAGLDVERVVGLEGVASNMAPELREAPDEVLEHVRDVVRRTRSDRAVADTSEHFLAVGRA